jgi:hypothetical protein
MNGSRIYLADLALLLPGISIIAPECVQTDASEISTRVTDMEKETYGLQAYPPIHLPSCPTLRLLLIVQKVGHTTVLQEIA